MEQEQDKKRQKTVVFNHHNLDIEPISKGCQLWDEAVELAKHVVLSHNMNMNMVYRRRRYDSEETFGDDPRIFFIDLQNAAVEKGNDWSLYYLNFNASLKNGPPRLHQTALWVCTSQPTFSTSLSDRLGIVVHEDERISSNSNIPSNHATEALAQLACPNFPIIKVVKCSSQSVLAYKEYTFTVVALEDGQTNLFQVVVMEGEFGQPTESTGLTYISKSQLDWPFITPSWISLSLLLEVRHHFTNSFLCLDFENIGPLFLSLPSISQLPQIAESIGVEATRTKLIPFLTSTQYDVDVDTLIMIGKLLGTFIPYIGGVAHAPCLLPSLEILCSVSHPHVRQEAVNSLSQIAHEMDESDVLKLFTPLIKRLASGSCTSRAASLGLVDVVFPLLPYTEQKTMMKLYSKLADEEELLVRLSAAANLVGFADSMKSPHLEDIISIFQKLTSEGQDKSVRLFAVIGCNIFLRHLEPQCYKEHILPILLRLRKDTFEPIRRIAGEELLDLSGNQVQELA